MDLCGSSAIQGKVLAEELSQREDAKQRMFARWQSTQQRRTSIHAANGEGQAKIHKKLEEFIKKSEDYKSPLNYYPKSAKNPSSGRCSPSSAWHERRMDFVSEKPMLKVDGAPALHGWAT
jgi:hypothetical protein